MKKKCSWLKKQNERRRTKFCSERTAYQVNAAGKIFPPPQVACPITCENYCDPCFENPNTLYSHIKKANGKEIFKTCSNLSGKTQDQINKICSRTNSYSGYPIPSVACPVTCGESGCDE